MAKRTVVVTGEGTGTGNAIAKAFAQASASFITLIGRRKDQLEAAVDEIDDAKSTLLYMPVDLTKRDEAKEAMELIVAK